MVFKYIMFDGHIVKHEMLLCQVAKRTDCSPGSVQAPASALRLDVKQLASTIVLRLPPVVHFSLVSDQMPCFT